MTTTAHLLEGWVEDFCKLETGLTPLQAIRKWLPENPNRGQFIILLAFIEQFGTRDDLAVLTEYKVPYAEIWGIEEMIESARFLVLSRTLSGGMYTCPKGD